ncbi:2-dehydro-3-deoxygalactonokinase [Paracoccus sp. S3-43]|uniref:2-dehydro-3-deoxygalactonokinase n=1 Tax=Paracoccus sp. S3-43 TaxID=3030011 RepID=UPI0023B1FF28|nr:2-dehydro-3-deoxygalactonokinase [Paracoccus sp. S3-43]WEF25780.1 2-dehydro-3-deoxygalactonokinase [Paracoccus sp. S3-43]
MDWVAVERAEGELRLWHDGRTRAAPCTEDPGAALRGLLLPMPAPGRVLTVIASGWPGVDPVRVPCSPGRPAPALDLDPRIRLHPLPGLAQDRPTDLIVGPVPRIAGHLAARPDFDGVLCLPGSPSAWVQISASEVVSFRTFLTAEILSALAAQDDATADAGFADAVAQAMSRPAALAAELSSVRADLALNRIGRAAARTRIAGLLIGAELAAARPWWLGQNVVILGQGWLADCYAAALAAQGVVAERADPAQAWLAGMTTARQAI